MSSPTIKFFKVNNIPLEFEPDSVYLYRDAQDHITLAITDTDGQIIYTTHNTATIQSLIANYIASALNEPNGIAGIDSSGKIPLYLLPDTALVSDMVTIEGPAEVATNSTNIYRITNYTNLKPYTLTVNSPNVNVTRAGDTVYLSTQSVLEDVIITINGTEYTISVVTDPYVLIIPKITSPIDGINNIGPVIDVTTNYSVTTSYSISALNGHEFTRWEVAYEPTFTDIVFTIDDYTNLSGRIFSGSVEGIIDNQRIYIRCKFFLEDATSSEYSLPVSITTKNDFTPNKIDSTLINSESASGALFGNAVAISADGSRIIVGSSSASFAGPNRTGAAYIFAKNSNVWIQEAILLAPDRATDDFFGRSVELSLSGDRAIVGAYRANPYGVGDGGKAYVFVRSGTTWSYEDTLIASDYNGSGYFGWSVCLSGTAGRAIVGAYAADYNAPSNCGKCYIFKRDGSTWTQEAILTASDRVSNDNFGYAVAMDTTGERVIIGSYQADPAGVSNAGKAYVFFRSGTTWSQEAILIASDRAANDKFGFSVSINGYGNKIIVGAPTADHVGASDGGCAYIFSRSGTAWTQEAILTASDKATSDQFGWAVDIDLNGTKVSIGAYNKTVLGVSGAGKAYIFSKPDINWVEETTPIISPGVFATDAEFGYALSLNAAGDTLVVGEPRATVGGRTTAGKIHVFN